MEHVECDGIHGNAFDCREMYVTKWSTRNIQSMLSYTERSEHAEHAEHTELAEQAEHMELAGSMGFQVNA